MTRRIALLWSIAIVVVGVASTSAADSERFVIVVHPSNPATSVSRDFLRDAYLKKSTEWHGNTIRPVDLTSKFPVRARFTREVIRKSPAQLRTYWNQRVFSGQGVPPPAVSSVGDAIAYVLANEGGVAYLPADADPAGAKVIPLR